MTIDPKGAFAVVGRTKWGGLDSVTRWHVFEIARATEKRLYGVGPRGRYMDDFVTIDSILARFPKREAAEAFISTGLAEAAEAVKEAKAADDDHDLARKRCIAAHRQLDAASAEYLARAVVVQA